MCIRDRGIQHGVTEGDLFFPNRQTILRQKNSENLFNLSVGLLFQSRLIHFGTFSFEQFARMCWRQTNAAQLLNCAARIRRQRQSEKLKGLILMCRICCSPPGNLGNHTGRLAVYKPFTGSPKVLLITTQGRPTHLTCGQTIMRIIIPRPRSWRKGKLHPLFGQNASLKTNNWGHRPTNKWEAVCVRLVMALFPASLT